MRIFEQENQPGSRARRFQQAHQQVMYVLRQRLTFHCSRRRSFRNIQRENCVQQRSQRQQLALPGELRQHVLASCTLRHTVKPQSVTENAPPRQIRSRLLDRVSHSPPARNLPIPSFVEFPHLLREVLQQSRLPNSRLALDDNARTLPSFDKSLKRASKDSAFRLASDATHATD